MSLVGTGATRDPAASETPMDSHSRKRGRTVLRAICLTLATLVVLGVSMLGLDQYLHWRHDPDETMNSRGYRGEIVGSKQPGEIRVALVGESSAYGYGLIARYSLAVQLRDQIASEVGAGRISVVNLAANGDSIPCYAPTLQRFDWMQPDIVLIYAGYNDHPGTVNRQPSSCLRERNRIFRATGYWPVLGVYVREKLYSAFYGSVERGYLDAGARPVVGWALQAAAWDEEAAPIGSSAGTPEQSIEFFTTNLVRLVEDQLQLGRSVVYVTQPFLSDFHRRQQEAAKAVLAVFAAEPRFLHVNLGDALNLDDPQLSFDRMHPTPLGNSIISRALAGPLLRMAGRIEAVRQ